ncbi:MAG: outer membrane protein transport protein [Burkholderiales bacterium]|nr:outer membrane protein transport protein [Flavobacterium sp.]
MKKYLILILTGFVLSVVQSQNISDALRYSQDNLNGTARFQSMSGAFGALGGDFSSLNVNPAGAAVFANSQVGVSLINYNVKNKSDYFGNTNAVNNNTFDINQGGGILVFNVNDPKTNWKKFTLAVNYENTYNHDNSLFAFGNNPNHSIADYFLSYANPNASQLGVPVVTLQNFYYDELNFREQQAFLGYQGYLINVNTEVGDNYSSNVPAGQNYQENYLESTGSNGKLTFNAAVQYKDRFYFGLNINSHFSDYTQSTIFYEENNNSQNSGVRNSTFSNDLHTYGTGLSLQFGAIAKITKAFRAGLAYESSTWYTLNDELRQNLSSTGFNYGNPANSNLSTVYTDSDLTIIYPEYKLQTPGKWTGSLAYVFNKSGLVSIDFGLKDYSNIRFKSTGFNYENTQINSLLDYATEFRAGAEKRFQNWSLRGGFRYEQSPYKNGKTVGDLTGGSGGFGYNFGSTNLDLSYSHTQRNSQQAFFSQGFTDGAQVKTARNNITLTLLFEL